MKIKRRCCYCLKEIEGRGKDAPTPFGIAYIDDKGDYFCCDECYNEKSGWGAWYENHEC